MNGWLTAWMPSDPGTVLLTIAIPWRMDLEVGEQ